jgi:hypothetical protein
MLLLSTNGPALQHLFDSDFDLDPPPTGDQRLDEIFREIKSAMRTKPGEVRALAKALRDRFCVYLPSSDGAFGYWTQDRRGENPPKATLENSQQLRLLFSPDNADFSKEEDLF